MYDDACRSVQDLCTLDIEVVNHVTAPLFEKKNTNNSPESASFPRSDSLFSFSPVPHLRLSVDGFLFTPNYSNLSFQLLKHGQLFIIILNYR
ncbi:hypothetical protein CEXT_219161 [Caerostris extrusa]|uniref:Uncharacterized protein n=1 Tax=Caerostris extrusa TaxID=172846 RepID=A0AAV4XL39_CAEEX|nr:hypothetical protein CEXT_219161 [Caerostris extrusa]